MDLPLWPCSLYYHNRRQSHPVAAGIDMLAGFVSLEELRGCGSSIADDVISYGVRNLYALGQELCIRLDETAAR